MADAAAPPDPNSPEARLTELAQRLGTPGAGKLYAAARRRNIRVTKEQVKRFVATKGQKQLFRPYPASKGQTGSEAPSMRFQMDLVDMRNSPSLGNRNMLVLVNVFTRKVFAVAIKDKTPEIVAPALREMLGRLTVVVISSDAGGEWAGAVQKLLDQKDIVHRVKIRFDPNTLAVVDRVIQNLKKRLAESLAESPGEWADRLPEVVRQYNDTGHETLHGEPPNEVMSNKTLQFMLTQDNARKLKHNQELLEERREQLEDAGAFRRPLAVTSRFKRGFQASYGPVEQVDTVTGSRVKPTGAGEPIDIKRVLPVDKDTGDVRPGFALGEARTEAKRQKVNALAMELYQFLGEEERSMNAVAAHLKKDLGEEEYRRQLRSVGAEHLSDLVRLFPDLQLTRNGYYVRRN